MLFSPGKLLADRFGGVRVHIRRLLISPGTCVFTDKMNMCKSARENAPISCT